MPYDAMTMAAVADELGRLATAGRIQKIIQPSRYAVGLAIYNAGHQHWLLLSADPRLARVHVSGDRLAKAFSTPSSFIMLLRKHLDGARIEEVVQTPYERVLTVSCRAHDQGVRLVAEVMGKHSNVILVDASNRVLGALKAVAPSASRVRPILPGRVYYPPPVQARDRGILPPGPHVDPSVLPEQFLHGLQEARSDAPLRTVLLGLLLGCSPFAADQIALRAGADPRAPVGGADANAILMASQALYDLFKTRDWHPTTFTDRRDRRDFAPYHPTGVDHVEETSSMSEAIDTVMEGEESRDPLASIRREILRDVERQEQRARRRIASLTAGLEGAGEAERVMQDGQLILAYGHAIEPGSDQLTIPELGITIALDARRSAAENAERAFRRYRKLRDARARIPRMLDEAEREAATLAEMETFVRIAGSEADLRDLRRDLGAETVRQGKAKRPKRRGPVRLHLDSYTATVGRSARENEEVTFRLARRDDLWLHARERTGAHVVLQGPDSQPSEEIVRSAAALAAYFSEGRADTAVDVDVTAVKHVRKIPGGPPGRVTYRDFRTVRVTPGMEEWQREKQAPD